MKALSASSKSGVFYAYHKVSLCLVNRIPGSPFVRAFLPSSHPFTLPSQSSTMKLSNSCLLAAQLATMALCEYMPTSVYDVQNSIKLVGTVALFYLFTSGTPDHTKPTSPTPPSTLATTATTSRVSATPAPGPENPTRKLGFHARPEHDLQRARCIPDDVGTRIRGYATSPFRLELLPVNG